MKQLQPTRSTRRTALATERDIRNAYRLFLGRPVESLTTIRDMASKPLLVVIEELLLSDEFIAGIEQAILNHGQAEPWLFDGFPRVRLRQWAAESLPLGSVAAKEVIGCETWRCMFASTFNAAGFKRFVQSRPKLIRLEKLAVELGSKDARPLARDFYEECVA